MREFASIAGDALGLMTPLLLAALGGLFTELAGMLNIALEGLITIGAFAAAVAARAASLAGVEGYALCGIGLGAGMAAGGLFALGYGLAAQRLKANDFVAGLATNLLASGLVVALAERLLGNKGVVPLSIPALPKPFAMAGAVAGPEGQVPFFEEVFLRQDILAWAGWIAVIVAWFAIARTTFGLRLRAAGSNPKALVALGGRPAGYRLAAVLVSGLACGLAGASLTVGLSAYVPDVSAGRGWIALVAIYLGGRKPGGVLAACLVFALADSLSNWAQGLLKVPADFILAMPYAITLGALVLGAAWSKARARGPGPLR